MHMRPQSSDFSFNECGSNMSLNQRNNFTPHSLLIRKRAGDRAVSPGYPTGNKLSQCLHLSRCSKGIRLFTNPDETPAWRSFKNRNRNNFTLIPVHVFSLHFQLHAHLECKKTSRPPWWYHHGNGLSFCKVIRQDINASSCFYMHSQAAARSPC